MKTTDEISFQNVCNTIKHRENKTSETLTNAINNHGNLSFKIDKSNKLKCKFNLTLGIIFIFKLIMNSYYTIMYSY